MTTRASTIRTLETPRWRWGKTVAPIVSAAVLLVLPPGCVPRRSGLGAECEINSECRTPLVCRLGHCRVECVTSADCGAGLACVLDAQGIGGCQLEAETSCTLASDCTAPLVCRFMQCVNACETDRDCPGGARCERGPDGPACIDRSVEPCALDVDCDVLGERGAPTRCVQGRCRPECRTDRDCRNDFWCDDLTAACLPLPRFARPDSGVDAVSVTTDAPVADARTPDAPAPPECSTSMPLPSAWPAPVTLSGIGAGDASFVIAAGRLIVVDPTDAIAGRGGNVYTLDLATHASFTTTPFAEARKDMELTTDGTRVFVIGGFASGTPLVLRELFEIDPATGIATGLGTMDGESRAHAGIAVCGTHVVRAGGLRVPGMPNEGSTTIDVFDLTAPSRTGLTLPVPVRDLTVASTATHAYVLGGVTVPPGGLPYASNLLTIVDCAAGTARELTMPRYYGGAPLVMGARATLAAVADGHLYVSGVHYVDGSTRTDSVAARPTYDTIDVFDLATETWEFLPVPATRRDVPMETPASLAMAGRRLVRALRTVVAILDLDAGTWRCFWDGTDYVIGVFWDAGTLYTLSYATSDLVVRAYELP